MTLVLSFSYFYVINSLQFMFFVQFEQEFIFVILLVLFLRILSSKPVLLWLGIYHAINVVSAHLGKISALDKLKRNQEYTFTILFIQYSMFDCLIICFLGGCLPDNITFQMRAPGAVHHARWMQKIIYTLKIAMLHEQLTKYYEQDFLRK